MRLQGHVHKEVTETEQCWQVKKTQTKCKHSETADWKCKKTFGSSEGGTAAGIEQQTSWNTL